MTNPLSPASLDACGRVCREVCAYKGEPSCIEIDGYHGDVWDPCEVCNPAGALLEATEAENKRLRASLERMLSDIDYMIEWGDIDDVRSDIIYVEARAALKGSEV
jgi:hypothetical protein